MWFYKFCSFQGFIKLWVSWPWVLVLALACCLASGGLPLRVWFLASIPALAVAWFAFFVKLLFSCRFSENA